MGVSTQETFNVCLEFSFFKISDQNISVQLLSGKKQKKKTRINEAISGEQFGEVGKYMENSGCGEIDPNGQNMDWLEHIMKKF